MTTEIDARLAALGLSLPDAPTPAANYVPYVRTGDLLHVSGQLPFEGGKLITGQLGNDIDIEGGARAARACALSLLAQAKAACDGDLGRLVRVVKLTGFVNSAPGFHEQPQVINGASDLMAEVLGESGRHARSAVGVSALPFGVAVEIEGIFEIT